jgi:major membrane immunogen (membrane-anchored lipoprotein)
MKISKLLFVVLLFVLLLAACGGGDGDAPTDVVETAFKAIEKLDMDEASKYVCQAQKEEFISSFDVAGGLGDLVGPGVDPDKVLDAVKIKLEGMEYQETSKSDDEAVVHIKGTLQMSFDKDKLKPLVKEAAEAAGQSVSDDEIDMLLGMVEGMLGEGVPIDEDMQLIKEDGKWVMCPED